MVPDALHAPSRWCVCVHADWYWSGPSSATSCESPLLPIGHVAPWFAYTGGTDPEPTQDVRATAAVRYVKATLFKLFAQRDAANAGSTRDACVVDSTEPS